MSAIPVLPSIAPLAATSDLWFVDIWGVMHNGVRPVRIVGRGVRSVSQAGRHRVARHQCTASARKRRHATRPASAFARAAYDEIVSSGDVSREPDRGLGRAAASCTSAPSATCRFSPGSGRPRRNRAMTPRSPFAPASTTTRRETPADYADHARQAQVARRADDLRQSRSDRRARRPYHLLRRRGRAAYEALGGTSATPASLFSRSTNWRWSSAALCAARRSTRTACSRSATASRPILPAREFRRPRRFHRERRACAPGRSRWPMLRPGYFGRRCPAADRRHERVRLVVCMTLLAVPSKATIQGTYNENPLNRQHDLADVRAAFHASVGLARVGRGETCRRSAL